MENLTDTVRVTSAFIGYEFAQLTRPASAGLAAGSCTWPDRGMRGDEPSRLSLHFRQARLISTIKRQNGRDTVSYQVVGAGQGKTDLIRFIQAFERGQEFQVHAYTSRSRSGNVLIVTKFGP